MRFITFIMLSVASVSSYGLSQDAQGGDWLSWITRDPSVRPDVYPITIEVDEEAGLIRMTFPGGRSKTYPSSIVSSGDRDPESARRLEDDYRSAIQYKIRSLEESYLRVQRLEQLRETEPEQIVATFRSLTDDFPPPWMNVQDVTGTLGTLLEDVKSLLSQGRLQDAVDLRLLLSKSVAEFVSEQGPVAMDLLEKYDEIGETQEYLDALKKVRISWFEAQEMNALRAKIKIEAFLQSLDGAQVEVPLGTLASVGLALSKENLELPPAARKLGKKRLRPMRPVYKAACLAKILKTYACLKETEEASKKKVLQLLVTGAEHAVRNLRPLRQEVHEAILRIREEKQKLEGAESPKNPEGDDAQKTHELPGPTRISNTQEAPNTADDTSDAQEAENSPALESAPEKDMKFVAEEDSVGREEAEQVLSERPSLARRLDHQLQALKLILETANYVEDVETYWKIRNTVLSEFRSVEELNLCLRRFTRERMGLHAEAVFGRWPQDEKSNTR